MTDLCQPWVILARKHCGHRIGTSSPVGVNWQTCRKYVMSFVWESMQRNDELSPPFLRHPERSRFISSRRIKEIREVESISDRGHLVVEQDGFIVLLARGLGYARRRGVLGHEVGHTFLYDIDMEPPSLLLPDSFSWRQIEGPAYEIGRQILVPDKSLAQHQKEPGIRQFFELQGIFEVSRETLARRLIHDLRLWDVLIVLSPQTSLRAGSISPVRSTFKGASFKAFNARRYAEELDRLVQNAEPGSISQTTHLFGRKRLIVECFKSRSERSSMCLIRRS